MSYHWEMWPEGQPERRIKGNGRLGYIWAYVRTTVRCFSITNPQRMCIMTWQQ